MGATDRQYRFVKQELMLRFFAFHDRPERYTGHISKFLNDYMQDFRNPSQEFLSSKDELLKATSDLTWTKVFDQKVPQKLPNTTLEAILIGVSKNIDHLKAINTEGAQVLLHKLQNHAQFSDESLAEGLSKKPKVDERLAAAIRIFSGN